MRLTEDGGGGGGGVIVVYYPSTPGPTPSPGTGPAPGGGGPGTGGSLNGPVVTPLTYNIMALRYLNNLGFDIERSGYPYEPGNEQVLQGLINLTTGNLPGYEQREALANALIDFGMKNPNNKNAVIKIIEYVVKNNKSPESMQIAGEMMEAINDGISRYRVTQMIDEMIGTGLSFDISKSAVSPFNIDMTAVEGNTPDRIKFRSIYNMLTQSPKFKELFVDLFSSSDLINAKFKIENIPQTNPNGTIHGYAQIKQHSSGKLSNEIVINRQSLLTESNDILAQTIMHECIHAYLSVKLKNANNGISIPNLNNKDFTQCVNQYYNGFSGMQTQHSFFVDYMIPTMREIFFDIHTLIHTPQQIMKAEDPLNYNGNTINAPIPNSNPLAPSATVLPWNWNDYYTHLSYVGLEQSTAFPIVYPPNSVALYYFIEYYRTGAAMFTP